MYWLARFIWESLFYVLVLVAVFMQVYGSAECHSLIGVFIAIIVMASFFLFLEVRQFFYNPRRYVQYVGSPFRLRWYSPFPFTY